jgi:hypothetical protein
MTGSRMPQERPTSLAKRQRQQSAFGDEASKGADCVSTLIEIHEEPVGADDVETPAPENKVEPIEITVDEFDLDARGRRIVLAERAQLG